MRPLAPQLELITPASPAERGAQLSVRIAGGAARGREVFEGLNARGVVTDWRAPDVIRAAPVPFYNRFEDAWHLGQALRELLRP